MVLFKYGGGLKIPKKHEIIFKQPLKSEQKKNIRKDDRFKGLHQAEQSGIEESQDENCADEIIRLLIDHIQLNNIAPNQLQKAHRLVASKRPGQTNVGSNPNRPRPIFVCSLDFNLKETIRTKTSPAEEDNAQHQ